MSMESRQPGVLRAGAWALLALAGLWQLGLLLYTVLSRVAYPYDLEWMEGGILVHADRLGAGRDIYVPPSVEFVPYPYPPLYTALLGGLGRIFGLTYQLGRSISIAAMVALLGLMLWAIRRDADRRDRALAYVGAAMAAGFYAATYPWVEGWYDLVRGDSLLMALIVGGLLLVRSAATTERTGWPLHARAAAAAAVLTLAFFCKQTGWFYVIIGGGFMLVWRWRLLPAYVATSGVLGLGGTWLLNHRSDGWFWIYVYETKKSHDFSMDRFYASFGHILGKFPAMTAIIAAALVAVLAALLVRRRLPRSAAGFLMWAVVFAASCVVGALGWGTQWAHFNAYMPAMVTGALAAGAALPALAGAGAALLEARPRWARFAWIVPAAAAIALTIQLVHARWSPRVFLPTERDRAAGDALIAHLRELRAHGDIFIPYHPWYARLAGQREPYTPRMGILDITYSRRWQVAGLAEALRQGRFAAVILDDRPIGPELAPMRQGYRLHERLPASMAPRVYTGAKVVPASVWRPVVRQ